MEYVYQSEPTPYLYIPRLIPEPSFRSLAFPQLSYRANGRTGWDLLSGEEEWTALMQEPGWREMRDAFLSESTFREVLNAFGDDMLRLGCLVNPSKASLCGSAEPRADLQKPRLSATADPNALFLRLDIHETSEPKWSFIHCDWPRRVVSGMFFLSDAGSDGMHGGEFALYKDEAFRNDRTPHRPILAKCFKFISNQGIIFLNSNSSFHGPMMIQRATRPRRWAYFSISSRRDVWPVASKPLPKTV